MKGLADTGFLVAFANRNDTHHAWAVAIASHLTEPLLTCEAVLAEAAFHLRNSSTVLAMAQQGLVSLSFEAVDHLTTLAALAKQYANRQPDFAVLCLIRMSELYPLHPVITTDREDFSVYRRNKREIIPIVCPPER